MLSRRAFIAGLAVTLAPTSALAAISCSVPNQMGIRSCTVGLQNVPFVQQECQQWCWAACAEMAFRTQGFNVDQKVFVQKLFNGAMVCQPASGPAIQAAVRGNWQDQNGSTRYARFNLIMDLDYGIQNHPAPLDVIKNELQQGRLVIAGTLGHAICITAMEFYVNQWGQEQLASLIVRDPFPGSPNKYRMTPQQFWNGRFLATISF